MAAPVEVRPLRTTDQAALAVYFESLSETTRSVYGPHPFTAEQAAKICANLADKTVLTLVAVTPAGEIAAYFILRLEVSDGDRQRYAARGMTFAPGAVCSIAPSVADARQNQGLGSEVMARTVDVARGSGCRHMILQGGVRGANTRGIHFYRKCGFRHVATFVTAAGDNHDMILDLEPGESHVGTRSC